VKALCLIFPDGYGAFFFICQRHTQSQRLFVHLLHHTQMQHPMKVKIEESWRQRLQEEFDKPYFERKQAPHTDNRPSFAPFCRIRFLRMQAFQQSQQLSAEQRH
jgi:uracil-DNA glycosylase 2